jgi:5-methylcytosine-specific restriction endonuclease McrA
MASIRDTREYRLVRARHLRNNPKCRICGSIKGRAVHHMNSLRYFPDEALDPDNLVTLCDYRANNCHGMLHTVLKRSYRMKTTKDDFERFLKLLKFGKEKMVNTDS